MWFQRSWAWYNSVVADIELLSRHPAATSPGGLLTYNNTHGLATAAQSLVGALRAHRTNACFPAPTSRCPAPTARRAVPSPHSPRRGLPRDTLPVGGSWLRSRRARTNPARLHSRTRGLLVGDLP